jgi:Flp pilus assembly protein TadD
VSWISYAAPVELRAAEPTILCLLPPSYGRQSTTFPGLPPDGLQPAAFPRVPPDVLSSAVSPRRDLQPVSPSDSVVGSTATDTRRTTLTILRFSIVLLLILAAWHWQSPWRNLLSRMAYGLGSHLLEAGEYVNAMSLLQTSVDLNPRLASAYNDIGYILYRQGRSKDAQAVFQQAVVADPTFAVAQNNLGLSYLENGQLDLAREALEQAVALNPESAATWTNLGVVEHAAGRSEQAIRAYRAALRLDPDNSVVLANLGVLYYARRQFSEARSYLEEALEAQSMLTRAQAILGAIALDEGDHAHAWNELQTVASDLADDPLMHFYMALWYEEAGMWQMAEQELGRVLELQPHSDLVALVRSHLVALASFDQSLSVEETDTKGE